MNNEIKYKSIDRFKPKDQDIVKALAALMTAEDFPVLGLQRQGRRGAELAPGDQSVKMRLTSAGVTGDTSGRRRWLPSAYSEKDVSGFFRYRLEEAKYAVFLEVLGQDRAELLQSFNEGARQTLMNGNHDLSTRLRNMAVNVTDVYSPLARGRHLITWLCHTSWGGDAARAALHDFRLTEVEASMEAIKTLESASQGQMQIRERDPILPPEDFVTVISTISHGVMVDRLVGLIGSDREGTDLIGRAASCLMAWVMCRDDGDPTIHDLLCYLQHGRDQLEWKSQAVSNA